MEDFAFGTMATDPLKLTHHRAERSGLQHLHATDPIVPQPDQPITLRVIVGGDLTVDGIACTYTTDGSVPDGTRGWARNGAALPFRRVSVNWDSLTWAYHEVWEVTLPAQSDGTVITYQIDAWRGESEPIYADWPEVEVQIEETARAFFHGDQVKEMPSRPADQPETFSLLVQAARPPRLPEDFVIYQIFVDRFYPGDDRAWLQTRDMDQFCGGTLWGVRDKLAYLADLGVDAIWLSPIWPATSYHGYDIVNYRGVCGHLGGEEATRALIEAAHARGIKVLLDFVVNHFSDEHPIFQEALLKVDSPYRDWFFFDQSELGYRSFFGVKSMPQINLDHPDARAWMIENGLFWIREFGVDGYRLDHANGPGPDFWVDFRQALRAEKEDVILFGEVVEPPETQLRYVGRLDGLLDFNLCDMIRRAYARDEISRVAFATFMERHTRYFDQANFQRYVFFDNHDMDRFLFAAGDDQVKLREAFSLIAALPQPLVIYYGTEVGLSQKASKNSGFGLEMSRLPMLWDKQQDQGLLTFFKETIAARKRK